MSLPLQFDYIVEIFMGVDNTCFKVAFFRSFQWIHLKCKASPFVKTDAGTCQNNEGRATEEPWGAAGPDVPEH